MLRFHVPKEPLGVVIFFALTEPPSPNPTPTHPTSQDSPETTRNGPETDRNGPETPETDRKWIELGIFQAFKGGAGGVLSGWGIASKAPWRKLPLRPEVC